MDNAILIKNDIILFYGNNAGYIDGNQAVVDTMFESKELSEFLNKKGYEIKLSTGVFDRLVSAKHRIDDENLKIKSCRIYQLKTDVNPNIKFVSYSDLLNMRCRVEEENYTLVYDCEVETNNLDEIYDRFSENLPSQYKGHPISMSDIIEIYDRNQSNFYYVDRSGFKEIVINKDKLIPKEVISTEERKQMPKEMSVDILIKLLEADESDTRCLTKYLQNNGLKILLDDYEILNLTERTKQKLKALKILLEL